MSKHIDEGGGPSLSAVAAAAGSNAVIHVSPSQLATYRLCPRKWAFSRLDGLRPPASGAQEFGSLCHARVERWLKTGEMPGDDDIGKTVLQAIKKGHLPTPGPHLFIEHKFSMPIEGVEDAEFHGYIDCVEPPAEISRGGVSEGWTPPLLIDHKFTSDLRWAKTPEELKSDPQALVYGAWARRKFSADEVTARWVYGAATGKERPRKPSGTKAVEITTSREQAAREWERLVADARRIVELVRIGGRANDVEPVTSACNAFGGCPFRSNCSLTAADRMAAGIAQWTAQRRNSLTLNDGIGTDAPASTGVLEDGMADMTLFERLQEMDKAKAVATSPAPVASTTPGAGVFGGTPVPATEAAPAPAAAKGGGINAPEGPAPKKAPEPEQQELPTPAAEASAPPATDDGKKPRAKKANGGGGGGLVVLMDCVIAKDAKGRSPTHLIDLLQPILAELAKETGKAHWKHVPFGEGAGSLALKLDRALADMRERIAKEGMMLAVDRGSSEAQAVLEVLYQHADFVVRGV